MDSLRAGSLLSEVNGELKFKGSQTYSSGIRELSRTCCFGCLPLPTDLPMMRSRDLLLVAEPLWLFVLVVDLFRRTKLAKDFHKGSSASQRPKFAGIRLPQKLTNG